MNGVASTIYLNDNAIMIQSCIQTVLVIHCIGRKKKRSAKINELRNYDLLDRIKYEIH